METDKGVARDAVLPDGRDSGPRSSADLYRRFTATANGSWLAKLSEPRSLEDLALATSLGLQRAPVAASSPEAAVALRPSDSASHTVRSSSSATRRAANQISDDALLSLLLTASSAGSGGPLAKSAARTEPALPGAITRIERPAISALDVSPSSLLADARGYLVRHPTVALGPARTRAAAAADADARISAAEHVGSSHDGAAGAGDAEAATAAPAADASATVAAHPAVAAAFAPEFDRIYTRIALGLAPLAVSAALAVDMDASQGGYGAASAAAGESGVAASVSDDIAAVRAQLVQQAAKRLTRLPDATGSTDEGAAAAGSGAAGASLAIAEAVLTALQDMLTDAGVVALVREAAASRLRL